MVALRDMKKTIDMNAYLNYEQFRVIYKQAEDINNHLQDNIYDIEKMIEERKEAEEDKAAEERENFHHFGCEITGVCTCEDRFGKKIDSETQRRVCSVCGGENEHDWEVHVAEMKAAANDY